MGCSILLNDISANTPIEYQAIVKNIAATAGNKTQLDTCDIETLLEQKNPFFDDQATQTKLEKFYKKFSSGNLTPDVFTSLGNLYERSIILKNVKPFTEIFGNAYPINYTNMCLVIKNHISPVFEDALLKDYMDGFCNEYKYRSVHPPIEFDKELIKNRMIRVISTPSAKTFIGIANDAVCTDKLCTKTKSIIVTENKDFIVITNDRFHKAEISYFLKDNDNQLFKITIDFQSFFSDHQDDNLGISISLNEFFKKKYTYPPVKYIKVESNLNGKEILQYLNDALTENPINTTLLKTIENHSGQNGISFPNPYEFRFNIYPLFNTIFTRHGTKGSYGLLLGLEKLYPETFTGWGIDLGYEREFNYSEAPELTMPNHVVTLRYKPILGSPILEMGNIKMFQIYASQKLLIHDSDHLGTVTTIGLPIIGEFLSLKNSGFPMMELDALNFGLGAYWNKGEPSLYWQYQISFKLFWSL